MSEWIRSADRMPEEGTEVLLWIPAYGRPFVGYVNWDNKHGWTSEGEPLGVDELPSLWMRVPPPPVDDPTSP